MSNIQKTEPEQIAEFDLKHRITGAAVLLFLGALVLPWLLGPPSEASKLDVSQEVLTTANVEPANIIVDASDSAATSINDVAETVYISKITPLDAKANKGLAKSGTQVVKKSSSDDSGKDNANALAELVKEQSEAIDSAAEGRVAKVNDQAKVDKKKAVESPKVDNIDQEKIKRENQLQAALKAEIKSQKEKTTTIVPAPTAESKITTKPKKVDVGWVVQVGLFTEKSRAIALISELKNKGFSASSSIVDTNRGKKTGTRVWLGPFIKRTSAISEQKRLKSKAGKDGFIRVYP